MDAGDKAPPSFSCGCHIGPSSSPVNTCGLPGGRGELLLSGLAGLALLLLSVSSCMDAETRWALWMAEVRGTLIIQFCCECPQVFTFTMQFVLFTRGVWGRPENSAATIFPEGGISHSAGI